jgi:hypothetical protein
VRLLIHVPVRQLQQQRRPTLLLRIFFLFSQN